MTTEQLDWVEREAHRNYDSRLQAFEALRREAVTTLTLAIALAGGALGFALDSVGSRPDWLVGATIVLAVYMGLAAAALVVWGLWTQDYYPPSNEPAVLASAFIDSAFSLEAAREAELDLLQERIVYNRRRAAGFGDLLNRVWLAIAAAPVVWLVAAAVAGVAAG